MIRDLLVGVCLVIASWYFKVPPLDILNTPDAKNITGVVVQIAAVMIGFMVTALSILITVSHQPLLENMRQSGHYNYLLRRLLATILTFGMTLAVGLFILFTAHPGQVELCLLLGSLIIASVFLLDSSYLFWRVLLNLDPEEEGQ